MKGFYSPINVLAEQMARPKGTGAEFMTELSKQPGFKQAEVEDRNLQALQSLPKMVREDFIANLKAQRPTMPTEKVLGEREPVSPTAVNKRVNQYIRQAASTQAENAESSGEARAIRNETLRRLRTSRPEHLESFKREVEQEPDFKAGPAHHEEYTLPGGKNYREILLQHPQGSFPGVEAHFGGAPNVLASMRVKDRTGPNGEKILHIEEIQSDWHQKGREKGYAPIGEDLQDTAEQAEMAHSKLREKLREAKSRSVAAEGALASDKPLYQDPEVRARYTEALKGHNRDIMHLMPQVMKAEEAHRVAKDRARTAVPDAPFKKNWHELALKRMIQHAAENGYDSIAITPGAEQAKRYGLSKQVGMVSYNPDEQHFQAFKPNRETLISEKGASPDRVSELIGSEAAKRLMSAPVNMGHHFLEGEDLDVGGEGMKGFYDKMLPKFLNQFGKKYGAQVGRTTIPGNPDDTDAVALRMGYTPRQWHDWTPAERATEVKKIDAANVTPLHTFPITPEMREDVTTKGMPLYAKGGAVEEEDVPRETVKAYKLFRVHHQHPGKLFPLFIGKHDPVEMGKWTPAEHIPTKGFAERPGWHAGDLPMATHIGEKSDTSLTAPDRRPRNQVWTEIEMPNDVDWQTEANKRGTNPSGRVVPVKAHITDQVPTGGHYRYKTNPNMTGSWLIGGSMKVNRILSDKEVKAINRTAKQADLPRNEPFDPKEFGFAKGGAVKPVVHGIIKERVTVSPNLDAMQYELMSAKRFTKKVK